MRRLYLLLVCAVFNAANTFAQSTTFSYTGSVQSYTVPAGVTKIGVTAFGAQGGNQTNDPAFGGAGARLYGEFAVTPGQVLNVIVGQQPAAALYTGGGGGGSFVWDATAGTVLVAAGGGGGAGYAEASDNGIDAVLTTDGANGGGGSTFGGAGTGGNGGTAPTGTCEGTYGAGGAGWLSNGAVGNGGFCSIAGGGATPISGAAGGVYGGTAIYNGSGGFGGGGGSQGQCAYSGGGGGGGYSGGGGGDYTCSPNGADPGGGGGSYNGGANQSNSIGNTGNGIVTICAFPVAGTITGLLALCPAGTTTLSDTDGLAGGTWMSSDPSVASIASTTGTVTAVSVGSVNITYMPTNACGSSITTAALTVNPLPTIGAGSDVAICSGASTGLLATGGVSYTWSPASGLSCTNCDNPTAMPTGTTTYTVTGAATTYADGCVNTATVTVSINPLPNAFNVTGGGSYCVGGAGMHVGLDTSNPGINYQLYYGLSTSGSPVAGTGSALDFGLQTGVGAYSVVATDTLTGCSADMVGSASIDTISIVHPTINIFMTTLDTICNGTSTTYLAIATGGGTTPSFQWMVNGSGVGTDTSSYTYTPANGDVVSLTMISSAACAMPDTLMDSVRMAVLPIADASVSIMATPGDTVCAGTAVTMVATPVNGGTFPIFTWVKNGSIVAVTPTYSYVPTDSDNISCTLISTYMCPSTILGLLAFSNTVHVQALQPLTPAITITGRPGIVILQSKPDTLTATPLDGGAGHTYQWYVNAAPIAGATNSVYIQTSFNNGDSVSCLVTRMDACALSTYNSVKLRVVPTGINELGIVDNLSLVPNPNNGTFSLKGMLGKTVDEELTLDITNLLGQVIYTGKLATHNGNIDEQIILDNTVANGIYLLNIRSSAGSTTVRFAISR